MLDKIRYRIVFNRAARLNARREGLVQIQLCQHGHSCYFSTHVYLRPSQFRNGLVVNHPDKHSLNYMLGRMKQDIENVELEYFRKGVVPTLAMMKTAIRESLAPGARLADFGEQCLKGSDRKAVTIAGYRTLFANLQKFRKDVLIADIDYTFIVKYEAWMKQQGISHNTRVSRLRQLKALLNEAVRREIISKNPFGSFKIPAMTSKKGYVTEEQLASIEQLGKADGINPYVRDAFLFCCYTGLRISDFLTLRTSHIADGWIHKTMQKTGYPVAVPIRFLFGGKAVGIISRYGRIERLVRRMGRNSEINQDLKAVFSLVGAPATFTFHTSRHTFATLLLNQGVAITSVQKMLGHTKVATTQIYGEVSQDTIEKDLMRTLHIA